nr:nitrilase-related carbon-nitrogen hydrolase [Burkholderia cenocepacia]
MVVSLPPLGIFGWANPITSAGALFPGMGWAGLALTVSILYVLAHHKRPLFASLPFVVFALAVNLLYRAPSPVQWVGVDTHIGSARDSFGEFDRLQAVKEALASSRLQHPDAVVFVLPELVGGDWSMNRIWWDSEATELTSSGQTALIGAYLPRAQNRRYVNALVSIGAERDRVLVDRVPVPISMWQPFAGTGALAYWTHSGVADVGGKRIATLICYEELLVWPALVSSAYSPDIYVGSANDWWARDTSIPAIQREATSAWARLFGKPFVWAHNV